MDQSQRRFRTQISDGVPSNARGFHSKMFVIPGDYLDVIDKATANHDLYFHYPMQVLDDVPYTTMMMLMVRVNSHYM